MATQIDSEFFGTKQFKEKFSLSPTTQHDLRKKGLPFYRLPNSSKILYKESEVLAWLTSQKGV